MSIFKALTSVALALLLFSGSSIAECDGFDQVSYGGFSARDIKEDVSICYAKNINDLAKATTCVSQAFAGISEKCASCFVESGTCSVQNCFQFCKDGMDNSTSCTTCFNLKCRPGFNKCAFPNGVPAGNN